MKIFLLALFVVSLASCTCSASFSRHPEPAQQSSVAQTAK